MDLITFVIGAGWIALLIVVVGTFVGWFDVWVHVKYRVWVQYDDTPESDTETPKEAP